MSDRGIIVKLLGFTAAMFILPLLSFYTLLNPVFKGRSVTRYWICFSTDVVCIGNSGYAGGFAALVANVVLIAYIYVAFQDDKKERAEEEADRKKKAQ